MKIAIIGSRGLTVDNLEKYLPENVTEIISGGAKGIDACAAKYAKASGIRLTEYLPQYDQFGKQAPLMRNMRIVQSAELIIAFWDGKSTGTEFVIDTCKALDKPIKIIHLSTCK